MIGATRVVYNASLYRRQKYYEEHKASLKMKPTDLYDEFPWMRELDSQGLCNAFQDLNKAYMNWFNSMVKKTKQSSKSPKYKKKTHSGLYRNAACQKDVSRLFQNGKIFLPKLKLVSYRAHLDLDRIKKYIISR